MSRRWFQQRERGSPLLLQLILWIALHVGRPFARMLLYPISLYFFLAAAEQRNASRLYLQRVLERKPHAGQVLRHIHCFAATILDRVYLLSGHHRDYRIEINNVRALLDLADNHQHCLLLGAHIGSFEVLRALAIEERPFRLKILMYPEHNKTLTNLLISVNPEIAETVIPLGQVDTVIQVHESLANGEVVGMLGDRAASRDKTVDCELLGGTARFPVGPAVLAASLRVPVILFLGLYRGNKHYEIHFERLPDADFRDRGSRSEQIQQWMQHYAERLEVKVRDLPYNWFNFYDFWEES
ncbi:MAG: lipid A biosynthesis acyltransferase [Gammaproteobacteria bacterium]|nr:lipid A biosynthesis acyltransferase [Gammaproteobacteria bacterium]